MPPPLPFDPTRDRKTPQVRTPKDDTPTPDVGEELDEAAVIIGWTSRTQLPFIRRGPPYPPRDIQ